MAETARFDQASGQFVNYYDTVRGHVRQEVTRHNLLEWLPEGKALEVLDFGGGDGRDAIWLAESGDSVILLDESQEMIIKAAANLRSANSSAKSNVDILLGDMDYLDDQEEQFDLVLSHGVLMYELDNPLGQLKRLSAKLRPGGLFSLLTKGHEAARSQISDDSELAEFEATGQFTNRLNQRAQAYNFAGMEKLLLQAGLQPLASYGVRILTDNDYRTLAEVPKTELTTIVAQEKRAAHDPAQRDQAQMLHVIATK